MTNAETGERKDKAEKQKNGLGNFRSRFRLGLRPRAPDASFLELIYAGFGYDLGNEASYTETLNYL